MFSDDTSSPCSCHNSTPALSSTSCCPQQCEAEQDQGLFSSSSAMPSNHYKSPHEVDGEYSYAYRWDNRSYPLIILTMLRLRSQCINTTPGHFTSLQWTFFYLCQYSWKFYPSTAQNNPQQNKLNQQEILSEYLILFLKYLYLSSSQLSAFHCIQILIALYMNHEQGNDDWDKTDISYSNSNLIPRIMGVQCVLASNSRIMNIDCS